MTPKIKWVKSEKDIPPHKEAIKTGAYMPNTNTIYLIKGKATKHVLYHEKYHALKRHPLKAKTPLQDASMEIEAEVYAYKITGNPKHVLGMLGGICYGLIVNWHLSPKRASQIINHALIKSHAPDAWMKDLVELKSHISQGNWDGVGKERRVKK